MKVKAIGSWSMGSISVTDGQELTLSPEVAQDLERRGHVRYEAKVIMPSVTVGPVSDATSSRPGRRRKTKTSEESKVTDE